MQPAATSCTLHAIDLDAIPFEFAINLLSEDERQRAEAFHFEHDRLRWAASRAALRILLGQQTGLAPRDIIFGVERSGRPYLLSPESGIDFNLSHAGTHGLVGISSAVRLGVDIEPYTRGASLAECVTAFCSAGEIERISALRQQEESSRELIQIWCAKEAYLKALGTGIGDLLPRLTSRWEPDGSVLFNPVSLRQSSLRIHFPVGLHALGYCSAVALPDALACPEIRWFKLDQS